MDWYLYKLRNLVENVFARLQHVRAISTRYDQLERHVYHLIGCMPCFMAVEVKCQQPLAETCASRQQNANISQLSSYKDHQPTTEKISCKAMSQLIVSPTCDDKICVELPFILAQRDKCA